MKQIYMRSWSVTFLTGDSGYVFTEKIRPGEVLFVLSCFAYAPTRKASDDIIVGIRNGSGDFILAAEAPLEVQYGMQAGVGVYVGEGDQVFAYFPDADNGDAIAIHIMGVLMELKDFQKELG